MPIGRTARSLAAGLLAAGLLGGACSDDGEPTADDGGASTTTTVGDETTSTTAEPDPSTTTTGDAVDSSTSVPEDEGISDLEALAADLLVQPAELGAPAEDQGYVPAEPPACGYDLDSEEPADVQVGTTLRTGDGTFVEVLRVYTDTDAAVAAYDAAVEHEAECSFGDRVVGSPVDVNDRVGADAATQFSVSDAGGSAVRITTRVADAVVTFSLDSPAGLVLDPVEVAAFGVGKILAALEA